MGPEPAVSEDADMLQGGGRCVIAGNSSHFLAGCMQKTGESEANCPPADDEAFLSCWCSWQALL